MLTMDSDGNFVDYYKVLQCDRNSSLEELKKSYQQLALTLHPDKSVEVENDVFLMIQKAWTILRDPESRRQYDAELSLQDHNETLLYDSISISDMDYNSGENVYTYSCRCGGTYLLEKYDRHMMPSQVIIGCDECSFSIQINM